MVSQTTQVHGGLVPEEGFGISFAATHADLCLELGEPTEIASDSVLA